VATSRLRQARADLVVDVLELGEERVTAFGEHVPALQIANCPPGRSSRHARS
jgi:hypothetical protein